MVSMDSLWLIYCMICWAAATVEKEPNTVTLSLACRSVRYVAQYIKVTAT